MQRIRRICSLPTLFLTWIKTCETYSARICRSEAKAAELNRAFLKIRRPVRTTFCLRVTPRTGAQR